MPDPRPPADHESPIAAGDTVSPAVAKILRDGAASGALTHVERLPARPGRTAAWPDWVPADLVAAFYRAGVRKPWAHQVAAAEHARAGRSVVMATGTASGKSVGYLTPALAAIGEGGSVLYLAPSRALAADQLRLVRALGQQQASRADASAAPAGSAFGTRWVRARSLARDLMGPHDIVKPSELARAREHAAAARGFSVALRA